ncbi:MAG: hypothetical protein KDM91_05250 [Verrucomicrobiae bacterium]|nr:hypothetical protein [Verrucomicrobiae bacterium]MCP5541906.1 hypothetical protein [Akkermansiaceae bacterium]MCP5551927.1 hypothetical protein [Akkermansiaceae bacterium]
MFRRGDKSCVVPPHKELKTGPRSGILRQAGISVDDFIAALNG